MSTDMTMTEAAEGLMVAEVRAIEAYYGRDLGQITGTSLVVALVWAYERRAWHATTGPAEKPNWSTFDAWTLGQLNDYFGSEIKEDPAEPISPAGKDSSPAV